MIEKGPKSYKAGFASETLSTVIEVESCDKSIDEKRIVTELNDDILAYGTRFKRMIFVVYDSEERSRNFIPTNHPCSHLCNRARIDNYDLGY